MRSGLLSTIALLGLLVGGVPGCHLTGRDGPVPRALAVSRQLSQRGVAAIEREDWDEAERLLSQAVRACPADVDARRHYASALWERGLRQKAIAQLEEANRLAGDNASLYALIAEMRLAMGDKDQAWRNVQRAIDLDPKLATAWAVRARIALENGQAEQALADYHRAAGLAPEDRQVKLAIAELYRQRNQPQRALSFLQSLADTYSPGEEPAEVLHLEGLACMALGRYDDAVEHLMAACMRGGATAETLYRLAEAQWLAGRPGEAAAAARDALALEPGHEPSQQLLDRMQIASGTESSSRR
jgi:tetratricopeptide (TPR) repeat protein